MIMNKILRLSLLCLVLLVYNNVWSATHTYDFTDLTQWVTESNGSTSPQATNTLSAIYYKTTNDCFTSSNAANTYFNSGYLMLKPPVTLTLPTFTNEKITNITVTNSKGCSATTNVAIVSGSETAVAGKTFSTTSTDYSYDIPDNYQQSKLGLSITTKNCQIVKIVITTSGSATSIAAPTITGTTPFVGTTDVTITGETGSTIYYTLDGTDPTTSTTTTGASPLTFSLNKTATVKAIAVSGSLTSTVTSKDFTLANYTDKTIADINTLTADLQFVNLKLANAKVVYVNGTSISVREGDKAVILYNTGLTLPLNSTISGDVKVDYTNYFGVHEVKKNSDTNADKLNITTSTSTELDPTTATVAEIIALNHIADLVKLTGVTITKETSGTKTNYFAVSGTDKVQLYSNTNSSLYTQLADDGNTHSIIAVFNNIYKSTVEIEPVNIDGNTTGINNISFDNDNNTPSFNINGQRVSDSFKGMIAKKGKKYINKQ